MLKYILALTLVAFIPLNANADVSTYGLSKEQVAQLEAQVAQIKAENVTKEVTGVSTVIQDPEKLSQYAEIGGAIAKSLGAAAKELGIAVNDFVSTPAGIMVMVLVVYHFVGGELISLGLGLFVIIPLIIYLWRHAVKWYRTVEVTYDDKGKATHVKCGRGVDEYDRRTNVGDHVAGFIVLNAVFAVAIMVTIFITFP